MPPPNAAAELLRLASVLGFSAELLGVGCGVRWFEALALGSSSVRVTVEVVAEGRDLIVEVRCPILGLDRSRIDDHVVTPPLRSVAVPSGDSYVLARAAARRTTGAQGVRRCIDAALTLLADIARRGLIRIVSAENDIVVARNRSRSLFLKVEDPKKALALAERLSRRCSGLGDYWLAAWLDIDAADFATQLGEMSRGLALAEPAWLVLGKPVTNAHAVIVYGSALGASGRCAEALALLTEAERLMATPADVFNVRVHRAIVLGLCGRVYEAIPLLEDLRADPSLIPPLRDHAEKVLGEIRRLRGGDDALVPPERDTFIAGIDRILNHASATLTTVQTQSDIERRDPEIRAELAEVRAAWDRLGLGQQVRLLMAEGGLAFYRDDMATAEMKFRAAALGAEETGDPMLINGAQVLLAWLPGGGRPRRARPQLPASATPSERMIANFDFAFHALKTADEAGFGARRAQQVLPDIFAAVRAIDGTRHRFESIEDRQAFAELGRRPYSLAAIVAGGLGRPILLVEVLERMRAQGLPSGGDSATPPDGLGAHSTQQALGDLIVGIPQFATVSGASEIEPGRKAVPLRDVVATIAGETAWWWTCQVLGDGVAWVVRRPNGKLAIDIVSLGDDRNERLRQIAAWFKSPAGYKNLIGHPLVEDRGRRLDGMLQEAADLLLPRPLAQAARAAATAGAPLRLVWAPPPEFGKVPVGLLPLGEHYRLLHGAAITVAPPTSLLSVVRPPRPRTRPIRETVVLGHDPRLGHATDIVGPAGLGVPASRVSGTQSHVGGTQPLAQVVATPEAVLRLWRDPSPALALFYGHVDADGVGSPLATSLRLSDPSSNLSAPLEVRAWLSRDRRGAPEVVVLCGCSSIEPGAVGTGEWWGFGVALLWQGSRQVLGSQWDLVDRPGTSAFTVELVTRLRNGTDPALVLHQLQLEWLTAWEGNRHRAFTGAASDRHPILWAGWVATGVRGS